MKLVVKNTDISQLYASIEWSGDIKQRSRTISVTYLYAPGAGFPLVEVHEGDAVALFDDAGNQRFIGAITKVQSKLSGDEVKFTARDILWYTSRNKAAGVYKGTPDDIARKICGEFNITIESLPEPAEQKQKKVISTGDKTIHDVITEAYGDGYYIQAVDKRLAVSAAGSEVVAVISGEANLLDADYSSSIENMVNRVQIIDKNGKILGTVQNDSDLQYGILQDVYKKEKDKDAQAEARKMLKGKDTSSSIECLGNWDCVAGKSIYILDTSNSMFGKFLITDDKHTFSGGVHQMTLGVEVAGTA